MKQTDIDNKKLKRLAEQYRRDFVPNRQEMQDRYAQMPDLATAIRNAALARRKDGKCESHQRRVGLQRLKLFERSIQKVRDHLARCRTFDDIHIIVSECRTEGIGPLTIYDTAVRIGAYLGLTPEKVYLHTGTKKGAKILGLDVSAGYMEPNELPLPLRRLLPDEVEDFLCIFKGAFRGRSRPRGCTFPQKRRVGVC